MKQHRLGGDEKESFSQEIMFSNQKPYVGITGKLRVNYVKNYGFLRVVYGIPRVFYGYVFFYGLFRQ